MIRPLLVGAAVCLAVASAPLDYLQAAKPDQPTGSVMSQPVSRVPVGTVPAAAFRAQAGVAPQASGSRRQVIDQYCLKCHNDKLKTAGVIFDKDKIDVEQIGPNKELLEKIVRKVGTGQMPPAGQERPDKATLDAFVRSLVTSLDRASAAAPNPGRPAVHRLNRTEYVNAVRDLLALDIDGRALLPADDSSYGFDNIADVLSMSPALLDRYMSAATKISRLAIGDPSIRPATQTYSVSRFVRQNVRMSEKLPFGTRGGTAIDHTFPVDGEYMIKVRLGKPGLGQTGIKGMDKAHQMEVRLDGTRLQLFSVGGEVTDGEYRGGIAFDPDDPVAARLHTYRVTADKHLEVRFSAKAGTRTVGVTFPKEPEFPEGNLAGRHAVMDRGGLNGNPEVATVEISGPFNGKAPEDTPSRRQILACRPTAGQNGAVCAKTILTTIARRAYRRPVTDIDIQPLLRFYETGQRAGGFDAGIQAALEAILVSPKFLFRIERDPAGAKPGSIHRLSDLELASRLSFFFWSSIPDDELLQSAERGKLHEPAVLEQQVRRLFADPRSSALVTNFAGQWLLLRNMRLSTPDPDIFPSFDDSLKEAFAKETELLFDDQLRSDRPVLDLLTADYTFLNDRLAEHYKIPNVYGSHFRKVKLTDETRFGLLGKGSVLTVTSYGDRTSVVKRGKWVLENLLGAPPPPPPANIPPLPENKDGVQITSLRERMEQHRKSPSCSVCHSRIDPLGFSLENFDAIGQWRDTEAGRPVETASVLPDGTKLNGPVAFRNALIGKRDEIVTNVVEQLLTYALGRGLEYYDAPAVRQIMRDSGRGDYRWSELFLGIVKSTPFQMRKVLGDEPAPAAASPVGAAQ